MAARVQMVNVTVLDDYQRVAREFGPWRRLPDEVDLRVITRHLTADEVVEAADDADALFVMREQTPLSAALLNRLPRLGLIVTKGMWNRAIDVDAATRLGITVTGTTSSSAATAELTWALILNVARRVSEGDRGMRGGEWSPVLGRELEGRTLGVVGLGAVGGRVARIGGAFGMDVVAWSQRMTADRAADAGARAVSKEELFRHADIVTLHVQLSSRTRGLVGAAELASMRETAYLINTARGGLVDETALIDALRAGRLAGAGLDVYSREPLPADHPFRALGNAVLTPHLGYLTEEGYRRHFEEGVENLAQWLRGQPVRVIGTPSGVVARRPSPQARSL